MHERDPIHRRFDPIASSFGLMFVVVATVFLFRAGSDTGRLLSTVWPVAALCLGISLVVTAVKSNGD